MKKFTKCKSRKLASAILSAVLSAGLALGGTGSLSAAAADVSGNNAAQPGLPADVSGNDGTGTVSGNDNMGENTLGDVSGNNLLMPMSASGLTDAAAMALAGRTKEAVTIDGALSEGIWTDVDSNDIAYLADATISNNISSFKTAWDDRNFYIGVTVVDGTVVTAENGKISDTIYENDGIEVFIDGNNGKSAWDANDFHLFIQYDGTLDVWGGSSGAWGKTGDLDGKMEHKVAMTDSGFAVEIAISFEALGVTPGDGTVMGLSMTNNDNDSLTGIARKEIIWNRGHNSGKPATWGTVCLYETRKPVVSTYGTPIMKAGAENWNPSIWNFADDYSLTFKNIPGSTLKFASLSDSEAFYLGMVIEGNDGASKPFAEMILSGDNKRSGGRKQEYCCVIQWNPVAAESWQQLNITVPGKDAQGNIIKPDKAKMKNVKYNLGGGSYAVILMIPWDQLTPPDAEGNVQRDNYSLMSFSVATGDNGEAKDAVRWTDSNAWTGNALDNAASLIMNNPNMIPMELNMAPEGTPFYTVSIPQGGSASGRINVTDGNPEDKLTYKLEAGYDAEKYGTVTVNEDTGEWTYTTPSADFVKPDRITRDEKYPDAADPAGVNFWIITEDGNGEAFRTRVEVRVEYTPTNVTYHVDGDNGNDNSDGLSHKTALKTIQAAHDKTRPGDTVLIYNSKVPYGWHSDEEYAADPSLYNHDAAIMLTNSGLPGHPITYKAADGQAPVIKANGSWCTLYIAGSYINVEGLNIQGKAGDLSYEEAWKCFWGKIAPADDPDYSTDWEYSTGNYNTNGVSIEPIPKHKIVHGSAGTPVTDAIVSIPHNISISNCVIEYMAGGSGGSQCDYITIENCTIANNGWWGMYGTSGISFLGTVDIDDNRDDYKFIIRGNEVAGNRHFIPWKAGTVRLSDGNGIIIDTTNERENDYKGKTLIANNLVYENGGSGIHTFRANNVDIINNTIFNNGSTPELSWSELFANECNNVNLYNNIVYSRTGNREDPNVSTVVNLAYDNNIFYNYREGSTVGTNAPGVILGADNQYGTDPMFKSLKPVATLPEGFDPKKDYPAEYYTVKTAREGTSPAQWSMAANAEAAGWYPGVDYNALAHGYDFTLAADSSAWGAADGEWQAQAGGSGYDNVVGIFAKGGAQLPDVEEPTPDPDPEPKPDPKPDPDPEPKPEPKPDPKPEPTPDPDPAPGPEPADPEPADSENGQDTDGQKSPLTMDNTMYQKNDTISGAVLFAGVLILLCGGAACAAFKAFHKKEEE